ncbi:hypothetical protein Q4561_18210 [Alteromonas sp. 1_MG-2023]|uniref:ParE family toxin-like protein n=1 Tax=Alteromonas sp. 1_MG-2023 TaxID=3062669 RepID=UPI0026E19793|nr:hypothetical protein [Alteromonas sp. 1_MG-2023]MDO6569012.1 hypothetical protein [Alteromonas sp. 1_MG-2023]
MTTVNLLFSEQSTSECRRYLTKAKAIEEALNTGVQYSRFGGKKLKLSKNLVRFKLGNYRLIFKYTPNGLIPESLIQRKHLSRFLKRR